MMQIQIVRIKDYVIALAIEGKMLDSVELAQKIDELDDITLPFIFCSGRH